MTFTFLPQLHAGTPTVSIRDNRGLAVRKLAWHRTMVGGTTNIRITRHQYNMHGQLVQSTDPRLYAAMQRDNTVKPNFTWHYGLAGSPLRTESVDGGQTISLSDIEGGPLLALTATDVTQRWRYEDDTLPGRPLLVSEQALGELTPCTTERFIWAGNTQAEKDHNLAGQCVRHYDTAGLNWLDSLSLTGATLFQSRQLLADDQEADWGSNEADWSSMLDEKIYPTRSMTDATGAPLTQTDAMGNRQRLAYDVAGQLVGSWLTLVGEDEQMIVKSLMYSAAGQKLREEHGNGIVTEYTYEPQTQRLTGINTRRPPGHPSGAKLLQDLRYAYDPVGNVISLRNDAEATRFWRNQKVAPENTYTYDTLYQLTRATGREMANIGQQGRQLPTLTTPLPADSTVYTNYTRTYTYDLGGNLSQFQHRVPATNNNYTTDITVSDRSNRGVLSQPGLTPGGVDALFDAAGHQKLLLPGLPLIWNSRGELQQATSVNREEAVSDLERYRYGGNGMRVLKISERQTSNAVQVQRVTYLPGLGLRMTRNGTTATATENLHVLTIGEAGRAQVHALHWEGTPPSGISNNQVRYSYDNLVGGSGLELDGRGEIISREEYYPYGGTAVWAVRSQIEANYKIVRYSYKERDATGLYYYGYRYYAPWVGRWLSPDPAGVVDGINLYRMVKNNPITLSDSNGLTGKRKSGASTSGAGPSPKKIKSTNIGGTSFNLHGGTHGQKGREQKRLGISKGSKTHESEHVIGYNVLANTLPRGGSTLARQIENHAPAYQEVAPAHNGNIAAGYSAYHIGSKNQGTPTEPDPARSGHAYRTYQKAYVEGDLAGKAIALNQRLYANTTFYQNVTKDPSKPLGTDIQQANDSFINMIQHTKAIPYMKSDGTVGAATVAYHDSFEAFEARAEMLKDGAYMHADERKALHKWLIDPANSSKPSFSRKEAMTPSQKTAISL